MIDGGFNQAAQQHKTTRKKQETIDKTSIFH
jgi:hypothetical protein